MESPSELRAICQAGKGDAPGWYRIHRGLSIYLTWALLHTPVRLNHVSLLMMLCGLVGAALLLPRRLEINAIGFVVLYLSFLLDKVDGEIARYRGASSAHGIQLDRFHHRLVEPCTLMAAALREYQGTGAPAVLLAAMASVFLGAVIEENQQLSPYILLKHLRETRRWPAALGSRAARTVGRLHDLVRPLKFFRMFIAYVPMLAVLFVLEAATPSPWLTWYFYASLAALAAFVVVQCAYYYFVGLDHEIEGWRSVLTSAEGGVAEDLREEMASGGSTRKSISTKPSASGTKPGGI